MSRKYAAIATLIILPSVLVACAGNPDNPVRRPPSYATPIGVQDYEVHCGASRVVTPFTSVDLFFKEDGTAKTRDEFCSEYRSDTRIRPSGN